MDSSAADRTALRNRERSVPTSDYTLGNALRSDALRILRALRRWPRRSGAWLLPRLPAILGVALVALLGGILGASLAPATTAQIGPLQVQVRVVPSVSPGVRLLLPPAGEVDFPTHRAPFAIEGRIAQVDLDGARQLVDSQTAVRALGDEAPSVLRSAVIRATLISLLCAFGAALALSLLVYRLVWRRTVQVAISLVGALVVCTGMTVATADPDRLAQPRFSGLLSQAPYIAGSVPGVLERLETYRSGLADIVRSVTALYATTGALSALSTEDDEDVIKVLHVSDIHLNPLAFDLIDRLVTQFNVDLVIDTGDITTWGTDLESSLLSRIGELSVPYVFVRGNHDSRRTARAVAAQKNAIVLEDRVVDVEGLTIAGIGDPVFTPESASGPTTPAETLPVATGNRAGASPGGTSQPTGSPFLTTPSISPTVSPTPASPTPTAASGPQGQSNTTLSQAIQNWNDTHLDDRVEIAAVHEPYQLNPLLGRVPTILAGHTHKRETRADGSGTRIFIEGSTGGAGLTSRGLNRLADGDPLPLAASILYVARRGPQAGQVVAMDAITVGGFGLTSVNLERTTYRKPTTLKPEATPTPSPTPSPSSPTP